MKIDGPVWALGTMSGTSLDGVDAALILSDGADIVEFGQTAYRRYTEEERGILVAALGRWPGEPGVDAAQEIVETAHAELMARFEAKLAGFHGQTLAHDPGGRGTHQVGDGAMLAQALELPVVWDFRSSDVALGGQGAPLAPFFHHACARWAGLAAPVVFLNLGGVGNLTWVNPNVAAPEAPDACLAFDTGPANAPIDDLMRARRGVRRDEEGALALSGEPDEALIRAILRRGYFLKMPPKSLDRNDFADVSDLVADLSDADAAATLVGLAAAAVAAGLEHCAQSPDRIFVTGGGRRNRALMAALSARIDCPVGPVEDLGLDGDMLEAQAFGYLAVRVARGWPTSAPGTTGVAAAVGGGRVSLPG